VRKVLSVSALAAAAIACGVPVAQAASGDCRVIRPATATAAEVSACRQDTWLHQGSSRLANTTAGSETPSWNTTQPTAADQDGGAAYVGFRPYEVITGESDPAIRPTVTGKFTGVLDNIAATMFVSSPVYQAAGVDPTNYYTLTIDGQTVWSNNTSDDEEVATPITAVDDKTGHIDFAFIGLYDALAAKGIANTPTTEHTITLSFINKYYGDGNFVLRYDSAEYPSGMAFNLEDEPLAGFVPMDATWQLEG
jgi:hypothetical protein